MIEERFGASAPWSVGVEEEAMLLDAETLDLTPAVYDLIEALSGTELPGALKLELHASVVELTTGICADAAEAGESLQALRSAAAAAADPLGVRLALVASHPFSAPDKQEIANEERYTAFVEYAGRSARRQGVSGLHVHVGMPDRDTCYHVLEQVLPWLPLVLALSVNSPYLDGIETGLLSTRVEVLAALPRSGAPPAFGSYANWAAFVERLQRAGLPLMSDYRSFWWDIRPHPFYGTLEIRMPDQPTALARTVGLVELLQRLCRTMAERPPGEVDPARRGDYAQNRWAASRFGPRAVLIHPDGDHVVSVPELTGELFDLVGPVGGLEGCEADRQLEVGRERGLDAICADVAERSLAF